MREIKQLVSMKVRRIVRQEIDIPNLGEKIKAARMASRKPLTDLAREAGISRNYWYQLEAEAVLGGVAEDTLLAIEKVLEIDLGVYFD